MGQTALRNNRGMTLIEVLIAMVILLIAALAMLQTSALSIHTNVANSLRDEAGGVAEGTMNQIRNIPFASLTDTGAAGAAEPTVERKHRAGSVSYAVRRIVRDISADAKQVTVTVTWTYKGKSSTHSITSIRRRNT